LNGFITSLIRINTIPCLWISAFLYRNIKKFTESINLKMETSYERVCRWTLFYP
jgi:hypothetical protein